MGLGHFVYPPAVIGRLRGTSLGAGPITLRRTFLEKYYFTRGGRYLRVPSLAVPVIVAMYKILAKAGSPVRLTASLSLRMMENRRARAA